VVFFYNNEIYKRLFKLIKYKIKCNYEIINN